MRRNIRRKMIGLTEKNAEGLTPGEEQLRALKWSVEDAKESLRQQKAKAKSLKAQLAPMKRERAALVSEVGRLTEDLADLQAAHDAEKFNHFHSRLELERARNARTMAESDLAAVASPREAAAKLSSNNYFLRDKIERLILANEELRTQMRQSHADLQDGASTIRAMQRELDERAAAEAANFCKP